MTRIFSPLGGAPHSLTLSSCSSLHFSQQALLNDYLLTQRTHQARLGHFLSVWRLLFTNTFTLHFSRNTGLEWKTSFKHNYRVSWYKQFYLHTRALACVCNVLAKNIFPTILLYITPNIQSK